MANLKDVQIQPKKLLGCYPIKLVLELMFPIFYNSFIFSYEALINLMPHFKTFNTALHSRLT